MRAIVTFARLVANAAPAALVVSFLLVELILAVNPEATPGAGALLGTWALMALAYGVPIAFALPLAFTCVRFFAARPLEIGWFHLKTAAWFLIAGVTFAFALAVVNLVSFLELLGGRGRARLTADLAVLLFAWGAAVALAARAQWRTGTARSRRLWLSMAVLAGGAALGYPILAATALRSRPTPSTIPEVQGRREPVVVLAIEGASFSEILPLASEGKLPNLSKILKEGSRGPLRTGRPCRSAGAWASLATGKLPQRHGIKEANVYRLGSIAEDLRMLPVGLGLRRWVPGRWLRSRPVAEGDLRARPVWSILDRLGVEALFLDWPLASAKEAGATEAPVPGGPARSDEWLGRIQGGVAMTEAEVRRLSLSIEADLRVHETLLRILWSQAAPRFIAARFPGMGDVGSSFPHVPHGEKVEGTPEEGAERYSRVTDRYYEMLDQLVGQIRGALPAGGHLLIVSPFGTESPGIVERLARRAAGLPGVAGGHDGGPAGVLMLAGPGVPQGRQVDDLRVTDVVPLTLYVLGLPVGRDMDGRLPRRLLTREYLEAHPITLIPSYG